MSFYCCVIIITKYKKKVKVTYKRLLISLIVISYTDCISEMCLLFFFICFNIGILIFLVICFISSIYAIMQKEFYLSIYLFFISQLLRRGTSVPVNATGWEFDIHSKKMNDFMQNSRMRLPKTENKNILILIECPNSIDCLCLYITKSFIF